MGFERLLHIPPKKTEIKTIKCLEVHAVKQTEKQYSLIVRRFHKETANFFVQRRNSQCTILSEASGAMQS